jgi:fibro-slime domain-containing protein
MESEELLRRLAVYGALTAIAVGAALVPRLAPSRATADPVFTSPPPIRLDGTVRDFRATHPDFDYTPAEGTGHYAGNVELALGPDGVPVFAGVSGGDGALDRFEITATGVEPTGRYAAMVTVLGAEIQSGGRMLPVTARIAIGGDTIEAFGPFEQAELGDVNLLPMPRRFVAAREYAGGTPISVLGASWLPAASGSDDGWREHMRADSALATPQIKLLRNGDPVPEIPGFQDQTSLAAFIVDYVDPVTRTIVLQGNQVIALFELGVTDLTSPAADFQDLVLLITLATDAQYFTRVDAYGKEIVTLDPGAHYGYRVDAQWRDVNGNPIAPHLFAAGRGDLPGVRGPSSNGGIHSGGTFMQWFRDDLSANLSTRHAIELLPVGAGVYEYWTDAFHPIDGLLFGNGPLGHNYFFTYKLELEFDYDAGTGQFVEFDGSDDAWLFVDGRLALDRGGVVPQDRQFVELDRLGLVDGRTYSMRLFYAQRQTQYADFHLRTNVFLRNATPEVRVTGGYD